jgi:hypothetical protein
LGVLTTFFKRIAYLEPNGTMLMYELESTQFLRYLREGNASALTSKELEKITKPIRQD